MNTINDYLAALIDRALSEDLDKAGDITSQAIFDESCNSSAVIKSKSGGVLSGSMLIGGVFHRIDPNLRIEQFCTDGAKLDRGTLIARVSGKVRSILAGERIVLNFLQHLSGIATQTAQLAAAIAHTSTRILDTRKTTPGMRQLEKMAVLHGGGLNHRFGLFDMILIKDTHVVHAGGVKPALERALHFRMSNPAVRIEVETQSRQEFIDALKMKPDRIMLDNMSLSDMAACVQLAKASGTPVEIEASGNITIETVAQVASTGVDFISSGSITHSALALDIHLVIESPAHCAPGSQNPIPSKTPQ